VLAVDCRSPVEVKDDAKEWEQVEVPYHMVEVLNQVDDPKALVLSISLLEFLATVANDGLICFTMIINVLLHVLVLTSVREHVINFRDDSQSNEVHDNIHDCNTGCNKGQRDELGKQCSRELKHRNQQSREICLESVKRLL